MIIYKLTFPNGKTYIGQTSKEKLKYRTNGGIGYVRAANGRFSKSAISLAIVKYGWINVKQEILEETKSQEKADELEAHYIKLFQSQDKKFGYNGASGGKSNYSYNQEVKNIQKGKHNSPKTEFKKGSIPLNRRIVVCLEDNKEFESTKSAGEYYHIPHRAIARVCRKEREQTHNLHFLYKS